MDVFLENHGTIWLVRPLNAAASDWIENNVSEDRQYFGNALAVEHRYIENLVAGMQGDGLEVSA